MSNINEGYMNRKWFLSLGLFAVVVLVCLYFVIANADSGNKIVKTVLAEDNCSVENQLCNSAIGIKCCSGFSCQAGSESDRFGLHLWNWQWDLATKTAAIELVGEAGIKWVREEIGWYKVEPEQGQWDWTKHDQTFQLLEDNGIEPLVVLQRPPVWASSAPSEVTDFTEITRYAPADIAEWENYVREVVGRYGYGEGGKAQVHYWEIWNEPPYLLVVNDGVDKVEEYFTLLKTAYDTIKSVDPTAKVALSGLSSRIMFTDLNPDGKQYVNDLLSSEGIGDYFDIFNIHLYGEHTTPEIGLGITKDLLAAYGLSDKPIWVTETNPVTGDVETDAKVLPMWFADLIKYGAEKVFWFFLINWDSGRSGLLVSKEDLTPQNTYWAYKDTIISLGVCTSGAEPTETDTPTITPTPVPGDANGDGVVNGVDYVVWLNHYNTTTTLGPAVGDFNYSGKVNGVDYVVWLNNYGYGR